MDTHIHTHTHTHMHTVPDLPVCVAQRAVAQCCSTQFILDQQNITEENFLEGLRTELRERFQNFRDIVAQLRQCKLLLHAHTH